MQNLGAIMGIAQSAGRERGKPNNIDPKKSEVQLKNIFVLVKWIIKGIKESAREHKWESAVSLAKLWRYSKDI